MLARAVAAGGGLAWVAGDRVYGNDRVRRDWLEQRPPADVLAGAVSELGGVTHVRPQIKPLLRTLPTPEWVRRRAGAGRTGLRISDGQRRELRAPPSPPGWQRWRLRRRSSSDPRDLTAYLVCACADRSLADQVQVAGMRGTVEERMQTAKGEVGLDQDEVRSWRGWYRHITLAMWAQAFLAVIRTEAGAEVAAKKGAVNSERYAPYGRVQGPPDAPIRVSCAAIRHLFWQLVVRVEQRVAAIRGWSWWRRGHQAGARYHQ